MANIKSAIKRVDIANRNNERNKAFKSEVKTYVKKFEEAVENADVENAKKYLQLAEKNLRKGASKNIFHKNTISRKIGQLTKKFNEMTK